MAVKFLDLVKQYEGIKPQIDGAVAAVVRDAAFISGPYVARFERAFAEYLDAPHCIACANGTDALEIALETLSLPSGAEAIVPANSFIASAEAVTRSGLRVLFCDCDPNDYTISTESLRSKITERTKAIIAVHLYGQPCNMDSILETARLYGLKVVEDCAQAHGTHYKGRHVGTIGDVGTFSFYPGKNLGAYGDAGAIVTANDELARRARMIGNHGRAAKYDHAFEGRNSRMDGIQASILTVKLSCLELWLKRREDIAHRYRTGLQGVGDLVLPVVRNWGRHAFHLYVVRTRFRDRLRDFLAARGIETGIHYPIALPKLAAYVYCGQAEEPFFACRSDCELLSLPIGDHMNMEAADEVVEACREFFAVPGKPADVNHSDYSR